MKVIYDDNYGADADGNRGIRVVDKIILEESDREEVQIAIEFYFESSYIDSIEDLREDIYIDFEEHEVLVSVEEWFNEKEIEQLYYRLMEK